MSALVHLDAEIKKQMALEILGLTQRMRRSQYIYEMMQIKYPNINRDVFKLIFEGLINTGKIDKVYGETRAAMYVANENGKKDFLEWKKQFDNSPKRNA